MNNTTKNTNTEKNRTLRVTELTHRQIRVLCARNKMTADELIHNMIVKTNTCQGEHDCARCAASDHCVLGM